MAESYLPADFLDRLVCPQCKGQLKAAESSLQCDHCRLAFPIKEGIPVMLIEEAASI